MANYILLDRHHNHCEPDYYGQPPAPPPLRGLMGYKWNVSKVSCVYVSTMLIDSNPNRAYPGLNISNNADMPLWLNAGNTASQTSFPAVQIPPGSNIDIPVVGKVMGIWPAGAIGDCQIIEFI